MNDKPQIVVVKDKYELRQRLKDDCCLIADHTLIELANSALHDS
jgi:hypothetical protein